MNLFFDTSALVKFFHEDFEALSKKDRKPIASAVDKQFMDREDFNITLKRKRLRSTYIPNLSLIFLGINQG